MHAPWPVRRGTANEGHQHDQAGVRHELGDLRDAADVLHAVGVSEAEVAVEAVANVVAVKQHRVAPERMQFLLDEVGDRRFARAGKPGEPQHGRPLALLLARESRSTSSACQWMFARAAAQNESVPRRRWRSHPVDQNKAAEFRFCVVGVERDRLIEADVDDANFVEIELLRRDVLACVLTLMLVLSR